MTHLQAKFVSCRIAKSIRYRGIRKFPFSRSSNYKVQMRVVANSVLPLRPISCPFFTFWPTLILSPLRVKYMFFIYYLSPYSTTTKLLGNRKSYPLSSIWTTFPSRAAVIGVLIGITKLIANWKGCLEPWLELTNHCNYLFSRKPKRRLWPNL